MRVSLRFTLFAVLTAPTLATISDSFRAFLKEKYGEDVANQMARTDLGPGGSFGGGKHVARENTT